MEEDLEMKRRLLAKRPEWPISKVEAGRREACVIDPLLGTSVMLLSLMVCVLILKERGVLFDCFGFKLILCFLENGG